MEALAGIRDSYGRAMIDLAGENEKVVALASDSKHSSKLAGFEEKYPDRFYEVGICEQNMVGMAAGLSLSGKIPFVSAISCFMSMRAYELIRTAIAYPKLNVKIAGMSAGFAYPQLGATHTCVEDISLMRAASNMTVLSPADNWETFKATKAMAYYTGPVYLRLGRYPVPDIYDENYDFRIGKASQLRDGYDGTIAATGSVVTYALEAWDLLKKEGISTRVINLSTIKPIDEELILKAAVETGVILTVEEHNVAGGMGSAVSEFVGQTHPVRMLLKGIPNETPPVAPREVLLKRYGLTAQGIADAMKSLISKYNYEYIS